MQKRSVGILLFPHVEILDFAGPLEVFSSAMALDAEFSDPDARLCNVFTVAESADPIRCNNPLTVIPDYTLEDCPHMDIFLAPGGRGTRTAIERPKLVDWIAERAKTNELTTSVCTGSFLLAKAGLLDGKSATTYFGSVPFMREHFPTVDTQENVRWVDAGDVVTSAGVSAGIDMSLYLLQRLYGKDVADATARNIEYDHWT